MELYRKQVDESSVAFRAFTLYRDMAPDDRSLRAVSQRCTKGVPLLKRWSSRHDWVRRAEEWDEECDRAVRKRNLSVKEDMAERHAKTACAAANAIMAPVITLLQRMQADPAYLEHIPPIELMKLAIQSAKTLHLVYRAEAAARGAMPLPEPETAGGELFELADWEPGCGWPAEREQ